MASYVIDGSVLPSAQLIGNVTVIGANRYTPDQRKAVLGYRPSTPLIVHSLTITNVSGITAAQVPFNGQFVIAPDFAAGPGDTLFDQGAKPGSIGTKVNNDIAGTLYVFREPFESEIVWHVEITLDGDLVDHGMYRWENGVWVAYKTWPQRAFEGTVAFDVLDPDHIYDYYAKLLGATMSEWSLDNRQLLDFADPDTCPDELLPYLAAQFNQALRAEEDASVLRTRLKASVPRYKQKALAQAVVIHLLSIGYSGYVHEVWVNPDNPTNYIDDDTGEKGTDWITVEHGSLKRDPGIAYVFLGGLNPKDGETVTVGDYITEVVFEFDDGGGVTPGNTAVLIGATVLETRDNLIAAITASVLPTVAVPGLWDADEPEARLNYGYLRTDSRTGLVINNYWPSSRVVLHINFISGESMDMLQSDANLLAFKEYIARELRLDVLPVYTDIRDFATDLEVSGNFGDGELLEVTDSMVLTEV